MPDSVTLNTKLNIIEIISTDVVSREDILDSFKKMEELYKIHKVNRVLVNTTKQTKLPNISDLIGVFSQLNSVFISALYYNESQITAKEIEDIETISVNRGKILKCFTDKEAAIEWLKK